MLPNAPKPFGVAAQLFSDQGPMVSSSIDTMIFKKEDIHVQEDYLCGVRL